MDLRVGGKRGGCGKPSQAEVVIVAHVVVEVVATEHAWRLWQGCPSRAHIDYGGKRRRI